MIYFEMEGSEIHVRYPLPVLPIVISLINFQIAAIQDGVFAVPLGIFMAGRTQISLAFIGAAILFRSTLRVPAEADSPCNEGGCGHRCVRDE